MSVALNISDIFLNIQDRDMEPFERGPSLTFGVFFLLTSMTWLLEEPLKRRPSPCCRRLPVLGLYQVTVSSLAIILTSVTTGAPAEAKLSPSYSLVTLYAAFSIPGLLTILCFYFRTLATILPRCVTL